MIAMIRRHRGCYREKRAGGCRRAPAGYTLLKQEGRHVDVLWSSNDFTTTDFISDKLVPPGRLIGSAGGRTKPSGIYVHTPTRSSSPAAVALSCSARANTRRVNCKRLIIHIKSRPCLNRQIVVGFSCSVSSLLCLPFFVVHTVSHVCITFGRFLKADLSFVVNSFISFS